MKRIDITLDPPSLDILKAYKLGGWPASYTIRKALENFYRFNKPKIDPEKFDGVDEISGKSVVEYD